VLDHKLLGRCPVGSHASLLACLGCLGASLAVVLPDHQSFSNLSTVWVPVLIVMTDGVDSHHLTLSPRLSGIGSSERSLSRVSHARPERWLLSNALLLGPESPLVSHCLLLSQLLLPKKHHMHHLLILLGILCVDIQQVCFVVHLLDFLKLVLRVIELLLVVLVLLISILLVLILDLYVVALLVLSVLQIWFVLNILLS